MDARGKEGWSAQGGQEGEGGQKLAKFCGRLLWMTLNTVRPLLSAELDYPRFLSPKLSTPNSYEIQSDLYYPRFLRLKFSTPK